MDKEISHSEQQARAQVESIVEMVRALERKTAAEDFAATLTPAQCIEILVQESRDNCMDADKEDEAAQERRAELEAMDEAEIREAIADGINDETLEPVGFQFDEDEARERIQEDALSVEVRSGWTTLDNKLKAEEFCILLCTGGPACRLIGDLDEHNEPTRCRIEHQDWGTPWTEYFPGREALDACETYARQFYFGE